MTAPPPLAGKTKKLSQRLDWNLLKTFHDIVAAQGITAAANAGWHKQSTISLALQRLEAHLGSRLCHRGRAGFDLTDEGRILHDFVQRICDNIDEVETALANSQNRVAGKISIAIISNFSHAALDELLGRYAAIYKEVVLTIAVFTWENVTKRLVSNDFDIGISAISYRHGDLRHDFLAREYHRIYCGRRHPLYGERPTLASLAQEAFVLTGADEPNSLTSFRLRHRLGETVTARTPSLGEARRLTVAGLGLCILPEALAAGDVEGGLLWPLTERHEEMSCDIFVISNPHAPRKVARDVFIALVEEITRARNEPA
ncbi:MAG: LysR family transcriptional regulator [Parvibaculaceae bacterium]